MDHGVYGENYLNHSCSWYCLSEASAFSTGCCILSDQGFVI